MKDKRLNFNERWLNKAVRIVSKSLDYILYSDETYNDAINIIRNSDTIKPNRIINKLRDYKKSQGL